MRNLFILMIKFFNYFFEGEEKKKMKLADNGCGYEKGKNTKFKNRKRFFTFLYPLLSVCKISIIIFFERGKLNH